MGHHLAQAITIQKFTARPRPADEFFKSLGPALPGPQHVSETHGTQALYWPAQLRRPAGDYVDRLVDFTGRPMYYSVLKGESAYADAGFDVDC